MLRAVKRILLLAALAGCGGSHGGTVPFAANDGAAPAPIADDAGTPTGDDDDTAPSPKEDAGPTPELRDPEAAGPFEIDEATGSKGGIAMHAFFPKTGDAVPVIAFAHGFQIAPAEYESHIRHLASFGYVALTVDYKAGFGGNDNTKQAESILTGLDWAAGHAKVGPHADASNAGMSGHSLGGKLALLAASLDPRVKAAIVLDPVDGNGITVADVLPKLGIPTAFLGETLDATGNFQACAPAAANFTTFYAKAKSPSFEVTVAGASHTSFVDDLSTCGIACAPCKMATTPAADVAKLSHGFLAAFYERYLRGNKAYDAYLAKSTELVAVASK